MKVSVVRLLYWLQVIVAFPNLSWGSQRPNVVVILADDMGWNDISLHGSKTPTPHIDGLATAGVALKNLVVNSVCSPTRASFYTGCDAVSNGFGGEVGARMNPSFRTIAQTFKAAGYRTGAFGKWHNGKPGSSDPWAVSPIKAGFDRFEGFHGGGTNFFNQLGKESPQRNWYVNDEASNSRTGYLTDLITDSATEFINQSSDKPFFCMIAHAAPHEPFQATDALLARVPAHIRGNIDLTEADVRRKSEEFALTLKKDEKTWEYGGFSEAERKVVYSAMKIGLDDGVGRVLGALKASGKDKDTIVLFFSDNGAMRFIREGNLPLRETKHSLYDGGIRVPGFLVFPSGGLTGGKAYESMIRGVDLFPTLAALAGVPIAEPQALDGIDHVPFITGEEDTPDLEWNGIFVYYGGYRDNRWKLIARSGSSELYDLKEDPSEKVDVAAEFPDVTMRLRAKHDAWLKKHEANVNYTPCSDDNVGEAQPEGEVLEVRLAGSKANINAGLPLPLGSFTGMKALGMGAETFFCTQGDRLIYDMKIERISEGQAAYITPMRESNPIFGGSRDVGVDADGVRVTSIHQDPVSALEWKRYVIGLGNSAASSVPDFCVVIESKIQAGLSVLIDNVGVLRPDGQVIPVWAGGIAPVSKNASLTSQTIQFRRGAP